MYAETILLYQNLHTSDLLMCDNVNSAGGGGGVEGIQEGVSQGQFETLL